MNVYDVNFAKVKDSFKKVVPEYECPVNSLIGEIQTEIIKKQEDDFVTIVSQTLGYQVNKQELIEALHYDRDQFHKGYLAGKAFEYNKAFDILALMNERLYARNEYYYKEAMRDAMDMVKKAFLEEDDE